MEANTQNEILDSLAEGIFTVDKNFKINFFNRAAERILGIEKENVIGKTCKTVFNTLLCSTDCPIAKTLQSGKSVFNLETKFSCVNGKTIPLKMNAAVLKNNLDEPVGGVVSFLDASLLIDIEKFLATTNFYGIVGHSKSMIDIFNLINEIADTDVSVLIQGETGTGKEMIANAIQSTSRRKNEKFIKVNCAVIPHNMLASELFGHVKGAFTDAVKDRIGRFELADKGTIFLDEIAEMPLQMQTQLLRVIQEGTFERLGESVTKKVDVRIIAATNSNIKNAISSGKFREDLFFRLNVIPVEIPPLRERKDDILFLVKHFIKKYNIIYNKKIHEIEEEALDSIMNYEYPGNVRELESIIEYGVIRAKKENAICRCCLPPTVRQSNDTNCGGKTKRSLSKIDNDDLIQLLKDNRWNKTAVAKILGVDRSTLWRYLKNDGPNNN
ncbi:MAG: sigma 54-interacting transcriptional regulator [Ignavibacteriales bacterium]|nr:sigma 54-interacting transcriptional regulator [Ignavibacteriales bacterium]